MTADPLRALVDARAECLAKAQDAYAAWHVADKADDAERKGMMMSLHGRMSNAFASFADLTRNFADALSQAGVVGGLETVGWTREIEWTDGWDSPQFFRSKPKPYLECVEYPDLVALIFKGERITQVYKLAAAPAAQVTPVELPNAEEGDFDCPKAEAARSCPCGFCRALRTPPALAVQGVVLATGWFHAIPKEDPLNRGEDDDYEFHDISDCPTQPCPKCIPASIVRRAAAAPAVVVDEVLKGWIADGDTIPPRLINACRDAICREFGNNGTDGYYKRILVKVFRALAAALGQEVGRG